MDFLLKSSTGKSREFYNLRHTELFLLSSEDCSALSASAMVTPQKLQLVFCFSRSLEKASTLSKNKIAIRFAKNVDIVPYVLDLGVLF